MIKQLSCSEKCRAHPYSKIGKDYDEAELFPDGICPRLYFTLYPYFLGIENGAWSESKEIWAACSAPRGCDCWVRKGNGKEVHAVVECANGCPRHKKGDKFIFMNTRRDHFMCAALVHEAYPYIWPDLNIPQCGSKNIVFCPDWKNPIAVELKRPAKMWWLSWYTVIEFIVVTTLFVAGFLLLT